MLMVEDVEDKEFERRPTRNKGYKNYKDETERICRHLMQRGDYRIGQLMITAVRASRNDTITESFPMPSEEDYSNSEDYLDAVEKVNDKRKKLTEELMYSIEAPELLRALNNLTGGLKCIECGNRYVKGSKYRCQTCLDELFEKGVSIDSGSESR